MYNGSKFNQTSRDKWTINGGARLDMNMAQKAPKNMYYHPYILKPYRCYQYCNNDGKFINICFGRKEYEGRECKDIFNDTNIIGPIGGNGLYDYVRGYLYKMPDKEIVYGPPK